MTDAPLTDADLAQIRARHERTTNPQWRDANDIGRLLRHIDAAHAEIDRLTTEIAEGISSQTMLKGLNVRDGQVIIETEPARELLLVLVASMRAMLDEYGAENYVEHEVTAPKAHLDLQDGEHPEDSYTVTIQRRYRPTPHEFRQRAEAERDQALAEVDRLRAEVDRRDDQLINLRAELSQLRGCPEHGHDCEPDDHIDPHAHQ